MDIRDNWMVVKLFNTVDITTDVYSFMRCDVRTYCSSISGNLDLSAGCVLCLPVVTISKTANTAYFVGSYKY